MIVGPLHDGLLRVIRGFSDFCHTVGIRMNTPVQGQSLLGFGHHFNLQFNMGADDLWVADGQGSQLCFHKRNPGYGLVCGGR